MYIIITTHLFFMLQLVDPSVILPQTIRMAHISSIHVDRRLNLPKVFQAHGITYANIINKTIKELKEPIALSVGDMVYLRSILQRKKIPGHLQHTGWMSWCLWTWENKSLPMKKSFDVSGICCMPQ